MTGMGQPTKDTEAYRLFSDEIDEEMITPGSEVIKDINAQEKVGTHFQKSFVAKADERGIGYKLSPEERAEIEREVAENGWNSICQCTQADFNDEDISVRQTKATLVNLYFEYGGNWAKVFKDSRSCSRRAMAVYWRDDLLKSYIRALDPILLLEARGVVVEVWKDGLDEKARLAAALRFLEAHDPYTYDRGVRKQVVANKGSIESALFSKVISDEEFLNSYIKDKLNKLPDNVREALEGSLSEKPALPAPEAAMSGSIQVADMSKLTDPFEIINSTGEKNAATTNQTDES